MFEGLRVGLVIPALNEAASVGAAVRGAPDWVDVVVVADNGSSDGTGHVGQAAGARVVREPRRGYGRACLAGVAALAPLSCDVLVFMDADGADDPADMARLLAPIAEGADFVVGARLQTAAPGALTLPQRFGNALACALMRWRWGGPFTDLGPFRAIRRDAYARLAMRAPTYGWTVEMQVRALRLGLRCREVPVGYRPRIGRSKISGTVRGVVLAGVFILGTIAREWPRGRTPTRV